MLFLFFLTVLRTACYLYPLLSPTIKSQLHAPMRNAVLVRRPTHRRRHTSAAQKGTDEPDRGPTGPAILRTLGHHLLEHCATSQAAPLDAGKYKNGAGFSTALAQQHGSWDVFAICPTTWRATSLHGPQASVLLKSPSQMHDQVVQKLELHGGVAAGRRLHHP